MPDFILPPVDRMLRHHKKWYKKDLTPYIEELLDIWSEYNVRGELDVITQGPSLTRFGLIPANRKSRIRAQKLIEVYKSVFGQKNVAVYESDEHVYIEIPWQIDEIYLGDILCNRTFKTSNSLPVAIGMDINRNYLLADLTETPHLLIAGNPGCGISTFLNGIIMSLLLKHTPDEIELYLCADRKQSDFAMYRPLPYCHYYREPRHVARLLDQLIAEVEDRYDKFVTYDCRNIYEYNRKIDTMKHIFVFIEEYADLAANVRRSTHTNLLDLSELSDAYGIHIILATHHPTSVRSFKDNFPVRACFCVSNVTQSYAVLDRKGAERLFRHGDLLFEDFMDESVFRLHSGNVTRHEIRRTISFLLENEKEGGHPRLRSSEALPDNSLFTKLFRIHVSD